MAGIQRLRTRFQGCTAGVLLTLAGCLGVAACGVSAGSSLGGGTSSGGNTTVTAVPCATATSGSATERTGGQVAQNRQAPLRESVRDQRVVPVTTLPPSVTYGQVGIAVEGTHFAPCDTIAVWAGNGLPESIYIADHHSDCTIITLERQVNGAWQPVASCTLGSVTQLVTVTTMQAAFVQLKPGSSVAPGANGAGWPSGTYRATFNYSLASNGTGQQTEIDSAQFTVG